MISFSDYATPKDPEYFKDQDESLHEFQDRSSLTLSQTFIISEAEKKLSTLGQRLAEGKITEKEIGLLDEAMDSVLLMALPTLSKTRISELPVALKVKLLQAWQHTFLA